MTTECSLIDIRDVQFNPHNTLEERAINFIKQIKNPYHFKYGKYEVVVEFIGDEKLEDKLISYLSNK